MYSYRNSNEVRLEIKSAQIMRKFVCIIIIILVMITRAAIMNNSMVFNEVTFSSEKKPLQIQRSKLLKEMELNIKELEYICD